jgi:two-component system nitrogen regulation response regulator GlnG
VRTFSSPRDVLQALEDDVPQVLVSDIRMPGGSGIDLLARSSRCTRACPSSS